MGKKKKTKHRKKRISVAPWLIFFLLLAGVIATVMAVRRVNDLRGQASGPCNDSNCLNVWVREYKKYQITNCDVPDDKDGDQQLCNKAGLIGICRGKQYCCPSSGVKWTSNLSACPTPTPSRTPTPTPTTTPMPTNTPTPTATPTPTRRPTPRPTSRPLPSATPTPTVQLVPTPESCNTSCKTDVDCKSNLACVYVSGYNKACRNRVCQLEDICLCPGGGYAGLWPYTTPTPEPGPAGLGGYQIPVSVAQFTNSKGQVGPQFTLSGRTDPEARVIISILPDGVGGDVTADASGRWSWRVPKKLSTGDKQLLVVATKSDGGQGQVKQSFSVVGGGGISVFGIILILLVLGALGFGAYVYFRQM